MTTIMVANWRFVTLIEHFDILLLFYIQQYSCNVVEINKTIISSYNMQKWQTGLLQLQKTQHRVKERCRDVTGQEIHETPDNHRVDSEIK